MTAQIEVELDIFSGRPNPTWTLSKPDADQCLEKLAALPPATPRDLAGNLGYRGFVLRITNGGGTEIVHAWNGTIRRERAGHQRYFNDPDRQMEKWLLNSGQHFLDRPVLQLVQDALRR